MKYDGKPPGVHAPLTERYTNRGRLAVCFHCRNVIRIDQDAADGTFKEHFDAPQDYHGRRRPAKNGRNEVCLAAVLLLDDSGIANLGFWQPYVNPPNIDCNTGAVRHRGTYMPVELAWCGSRGRPHFSHSLQAFAFHGSPGERRNVP